MSKTLFDAVRVVKGAPLTQADVAGVNAALAADYMLRPAPAPAAGAPAGSRRDLTDADIATAAVGLGASYAQLRAVDEVESGGGWFRDVRADILALDGPGGFLDGPDLPKILFEAHVFARETGGRFNASHPNLSSPKWNRALYVGGQGEYARLHRAMQLDRAAALKSASWGRYQIMGFNHARAGHATVEGFVDAMKAGEVEHLRAFCAFIKASALAPALAAISANPETCRAFARGYNGAGYATHDYHGKIARAFVKWGGR